MYIYSLRRRYLPRTRLPFTFSNDVPKMDLESTKAVTINVEVGVLIAWPSIDSRSTTTWWEPTHFVWCDMRGIVVAGSYSWTLRRRLRLPSSTGFNGVALPVADVFSEMMLRLAKQNPVK